jgi:hypothetical protein
MSRFRLNVVEAFAQGGRNPQELKALVQSDRVKGNPKKMAEAGLMFVSGRVGADAFTHAIPTATTTTHMEVLSPLLPPIPTPYAIGGGLAVTTAAMITGGVSLFKRGFHFWRAMENTHYLQKIDGLQRMLTAPSAKKPPN